jgi:hypothetical protein
VKTALLDYLVEHASAAEGSVPLVLSRRWSSPTPGCTSCWRPCWTAWSGCRGLFCFIGAEPTTEWLSGVAVDEGGFIRTDRDLPSQDLSATWLRLRRARLPYEPASPPSSPSAACGRGR